MEDEPDIVKKLKEEEKLQEKKEGTYESLEMLKSSPENIPNDTSEPSKDTKDEHIYTDKGKRKKQMGVGRDGTGRNGFRLGVKEKVLTLVLVSILLSTAITGYIGLGAIGDANDVAVSMTKDELISNAESNLMTLAEDKAYEVDMFCSGVASDAAGQAFYVYSAFTDDTYSNLVYMGDLYANFGYADWKHGANNSKINGILNETHW